MTQNSKGTTPNFRPKFFVGTHLLPSVHRFNRCMISINRLEHRKGDIYPNDWILDSRAFTRLESGKGHMPVEAYAGQIKRWAKCGNLVAAVSQDFMCEPFILDITGMTVKDHQDQTIGRYRRLMAIRPRDVYIMPVLQGFEPEDYRQHIDMYGDLLETGAWVGVGSVCKRNSTPNSVAEVLETIIIERPDLRLHAFGLKKTALKFERVSGLLESCDSMAWSFAARRQGRDPNDWREALQYTDDINNAPRQRDMFVGGITK